METRHASESSRALGAPRAHEADRREGGDHDPRRPSRRPGEAAGGAPALGILTRLERSLGPERFAQSFDGRARLRVRDGAVEVAASSKALSGLLERRFAETIRQAATEEFGHDVSVQDVRFVVEGCEEAAAKGSGDSQAVEAGSAPVVPPSVRKPIRPVLNERYRLESFVVGESNRLAYNAAAQMAEGRDPAFRHLFMHGPCGLGKTHLLQGIAHRFRELHPGAVVRVTSGEQFMTEFVSAIRAGGNGVAAGVERFRRQYRRVDLLCIDDVHFLTSKQATQEELLHTFDQIERSGARVVLVSDEHPRHLRKFSPALVSRFMAGMVAGIGAPEADLRARIARTFAQGRGLSLDESAIAMLVERTATLPGGSAVSVRELEGLITRLDALHRLRPGFGAGPEGRLGAALVQHALGGGVESGEADVMPTALRPVRIDDIIRQTCTALSVEVGDLAAKTRHVRVVLARAVITHLARSLTTLSFPEIARAIGRPNHSTVITAFQRLARQIAADEPVQLPGSAEPRTVGVLVRQLMQAIQTQAGRR